MKTIQILSLITVITLFGCNIFDEASPIINDPGIGEVEPDLVASTIGPFGWEIMQEAVQRETEELDNTVISPLSIAAALYMTYNGADGETKTAMGETLKLNGISPDSLNAAFLELTKLLEDTEAEVRLTSANAIFWDDARLSPSGNFLARMVSFYEAETFNEDFQNNAGAVLDKINSWVNDQTEGRIQKILDKLDPQEVMFLVNALYFIGDWEQPFVAEVTSDQAFTLSNGQEIRVPTMYQDNTFTYYDGNDFKGVSCTFADTSLAMWFVLPPAGQKIDDFIADISYEDIVEGLMLKANSGRLELQLPKFEVNYKIQLNDALKAMGMEIAFDPMQANFSNIGSTAFGNTYISRVEHKTFLKIDEKGAEGAAVTSVGIGVTSLPPSIKFDRPFLTILIHKSTQTPVFIGKIENPLRD